jgi:DNA-binding NarL/FixJ family response regulator
MPSLVLTDMNLPTGSGIDLLKWIRAEPSLHTLPVVILSSSTHPVEVHSAYALRVNAYLEKPPTFDGWRKLVAGMSEFWLSAAETPPERARFSYPSDWKSRADSEVDVVSRSPMAAADSPRASA